LITRRAAKSRDSYFDRSALWIKRKEQNTAPFQRVKGAFLRETRIL
jgi:hypothetical protein